jgi:DNA mismatch repair protein MutL
MNRIRLLPEQVANQIAAGEVVERPASVVKELVENSIDARSEKITVEIQSGGRSLIRVGDDGMGMSKDDALLCLERHATSKIQRAEDLASIESLGFRGEALPSIASVSRFTLSSRERESTEPEGTQVVVHGGKIIEVKAASSAPGTTIEVRQLFYNLPARRKFLRAEETEAAHIQHYLTLVALAHPAVALQFIKDGRLVWQFPAAKSADRFEALAIRLKALHGNPGALVKVNFSGNLGNAEIHDEEALREVAITSDFRVWGFAGAPGVSRATREDQHLFVNRRPVENRGLNYALQEGYHNSLMKGRFPVCALFVELHPSEVDVNIHPAKREVKFHRERAVRALMSRAIRQALLDFHLPVIEKTPIPISPAVPAESAPLQREFDSRREIISPIRTASVASPRIVPSQSSSPRPSEQTTPESLPPAAAPPRSLTRDEPVPLLHVPLRIVGVVGRLYVVLESDRGMVLLDQHAAHERILFEQMLARLERGGDAPSQKLLLPETIELSIQDTEFVRVHLPSLTRLGVGLSEFGERTYLLDALPAFAKPREPRRFVLEMIDELKQAGQNVNAARLGEDVVAKTVCRHAIKANDPLSLPEIERLVEDLRQCQMPYTCPHGRPTLIEMSHRELEKRFGRQA